MLHRWLQRYHSRIRTLRSSLVDIVKICCRFTDQTVTKVQLELANVINTLEKHKKLVADAATVGKVMILLENITCTLCNIIEQQHVISNNVAF